VTIPRFILFSSFLAAILLLLGWLTANYWITDASFGAIAGAILLTFLTGLMAYVITYIGLDKNIKQFSAMLIMGMFSKLVIGILAVVLVVIEFKSVLKPYVVTYILTYFVFTAFEVYSLMRKLRA
jgi:fructose-specific phosphotransferase system IIC component